jgi:hypothetical protein
VAIAKVNGFQAAEMRVYDAAIGRQQRQNPKPKAMYQLQGATGDSGSIVCRTFVFEYEAGMSLTTIFAEYRRAAERKTVTHKIGTTPHSYGEESEEAQEWDKVHHLSRSAEIATLQELGVPITFAKKPSDFHVELLHYL